jgi:hypothetical protein
MVKRDEVIFSEEIPYGVQLVVKGVLLIGTKKEEIRTAG